MRGQGGLSGSDPLWFSMYAAVAGVDLNTLAERIGHTDLTMLQKHYAAIVGSAAMDAANTIGKVFDGMLKDDGTETV